MDDKEKYGSGLYELLIKKELKFQLITYDKWMNPIKSERDWPYFNVTTSKLPEQGDMT
jgi:hypothetical protein